MRVNRSATKRALFGSAALAAGAVGFAGASFAQTPGEATQSSAYHGPYLTWAGKNAVPPAAPAPQPALAPMPTPAQEYASWPAPAVAPRPAPQPAYIAPPAPRPAAVAAYVAPPVTQPPPHAVHAAYVAPPVAQPPRQATHAAYVAPPATPATLPHKHHAVPQAATTAAAPAQPVAPAPAQTLAQNNAPAPAAAISSPSHVHFYSLHREYGLTPDKVAAPKDQPMVLIGPPDTPPAQKDDSDEGGKTDKHGDSEGADD